MNFTVTQF